MSSWILSSLAFLLTVLALQSSPVHAEMHLSQDDTVQEWSPVLDLVALTSHSKDSLASLTGIAPTTIPLFTPSFDAVLTTFDFYVPVYSLYRVNRYFLLV